MLAGMVACAYELGMAFGAEARAAEDRQARMEACDRFERCFRAMRMGIRLKLRLAQRGPAAAQRDAPSEREPVEARETERGERHVECAPDRERDYEPVSLPAFLKTLGVIRSDAAELGERLPEPLRREILPALEGLLARAEEAQAPPPHSADRAQLAASAGPTVLLAEKPSGPQRSGLRLPPPMAGPRLSKRPP
jgi:hypothetical protein